MEAAIRASAKVPEVIFDASRLPLSCPKFGTRDAPNNPEVIFPASRLGIRSAPNVPDVIFEVGKAGISLVPNDNRAEGTVPEVKLLADNAVRSTCCVTELEDNLASAKVPLVIFAVSRFGISEADRESLAEGTEPDVKFDALRLDKSTC